MPLDIQSSILSRMPIFIGLYRTESDYNISHWRRLDQASHIQDIPWMKFHLKDESYLNL